MKTLVIGHLYQLDNLEGDCQTLQFIQKEKNEEGVFKTVANGTTNEEVLEMLIDRLGHLIDKLPSPETAIAKTKLEEALMWLNKRTADRLKRGVENTPNP